MWTALTKKAVHANYAWNVKSYTSIAGVGFHEGEYEISGVFYLRRAGLHSRRRNDGIWR
jgi:hypothetical protein